MLALRSLSDSIKRVTRPIEEITLGPYSGSGKQNKSLMQHGAGQKIEAASLDFGQFHPQVQFQRGGVAFDE